MPFVRRTLLIASVAAALVGTGGASAAVTYTDLYTLTLPPGLSALQFNGYAKAAGGQVIAYGTTAGNPHAVLWNGTGTGVDINPAGYTFSYARATDGHQQVGDGASDTATNGDDHALLWNSSNAAIDLNPSSFKTSYATAVGGGQQVGVGNKSNGDTHALLWHGSNAVVDLNPGGYAASFAFGLGGGYQVGTGLPTGGTDDHALLWHGASTAIDLNPDGFTSSAAYGADDTHQVGGGFGTLTGGQSHALLWTGDKDAIDLNPLGFSFSVAFALQGNRQVGYGTSVADGQLHALLWNGSATGYVDLQSVLSPTLTSSRAFSTSGDTVYGYATDASGNYHAIAWTVPEPAALFLAAFAGVTLVRRTRRRRE